MTFATSKTAASFVTEVSFREEVINVFLSWTLRSGPPLLDTPDRTRQEFVHTCTSSPRLRECPFAKLSNHSFPSLSSWRNLFCIPLHCIILSTFQDIASFPSEPFIRPKNSCCQTVPFARGNKVWLRSISWHCPQQLFHDAGMLVVLWAALPQAYACFSFIFSTLLEQREEKCSLV
jgi:hypothetical protein